MRARNRLLHPEFFIHETLGAMTYAQRLLFAGLWMVADREGRLEDRPAMIKLFVFPWDGEIDVDDGLTQLHDAGFIIRYSVLGSRYISIPGWNRWQHVHPHEKKSSIPEYLDGMSGHVITCHAMSGTSTSTSTSNSASTSLNKPPALASLAGSRAKTKKKVDPRHAPLVTALADAYRDVRGSEYAFCGGRDAKAVASLLAKGADEEIVRRWRTALAHQGFPSVAEIHQLASHWNSFPPAASGDAWVSRMLDKTAETDRKYRAEIAEKNGGLN